MKVILLQDVENLGRKNEVKEVAEGYARNFLIPNGLVKLATDSSLKQLDQVKEKEEEKAAEELEKVQALVAKIDGFELEIAEKINEEGKVFGSISSLRVAKGLKEKGFKVKKNQVQMEKPIKETGEWPVKIVFPHGLEAEIRVIVSEEGEGSD